MTARFQFLTLACLTLCLGFGCAQPTDTPKPESDTSSTADNTPISPSMDAETSAPERHLSRELAAEGWIDLFDGESLFGWHSSDEGINWSVENGAITADSGPVGLLVTSVPFADFELLCEFRLAPEGNSGVFLRTSEKPEDLTADCYELNIADTHPDGFTTGSLVARQKLETPAQTPEPDAWQTFHVTCVGPNVVVKLDDQEVLKYDAGEGYKPSGLIGLQKNSGKVEFRRVALKPLSMTSLFNGEDLSGWREVPGSKSQFTVEDGVIRVKDGQGFYETEQTWADFIFQGDAKTHAAELNSGYFFRAMPGTEEAPSNGYEAQIHNGFNDGDRTKPNNAGTGAIFRRVEARKVVANDLEWFTTTIVAHGPKIAVWVDGYQVVDWEDTREPDPNPRKGLRVEAGHISLQGHDPTTDLSFRNLKIATLP